MSEHRRRGDADEVAMVKGRLELMMNPTKAL
jgi:hypothetical protein